MSDPETSPPQGGNPDSKPWMKFAGIGMELAGTTLGLAVLGYAVDRYRDRDDGLGVAAGALTGFALGMYRLIRQAMQEVHRQQTQQVRPTPEQSDQGQADNDSVA